MPPPSGTTDAHSAVAPETGNSSAVSKADAVPAKPPKSDRVTHGMGKLDLGEARPTVTVSDKATGSSASKEEIENSEQKMTLPEEPEAEDEEVGDASLKKAEPGPVTPATEEVNPKEAEPGADSKGDSSKTEDMAASNEAQNLPGTKTQNQPAASGKEAEDSVAD